MNMTVMKKWVYSVFCKHSPAERQPKKDHHITFLFGELTGGNNEGKNYLRLSPKNKKFKETDAFETAGVQSYTISLEKMKKIDKILVTSNPEDGVQNNTSISVNDD